MLKLGIIAVVVALLSASVVSAAGAEYPITLKKDLFSGYRWSADDGYSYQRVGHGGDSLRTYMSGNEQAVEKMYDYRIRRRVSRVASIVCAVGLGYTCYRLVDDSYTEPRDNSVVLGTLGVGIVAMTFNWMANNSLEDAVEIFNRDSGWPQLSVGLSSESASGGSTMSVGIAVSF